MSWWESLFPKRASDLQMDSELRFHLDELVEANIAAGMSPEDARRRAILEFGGREQVKEDLRDVYRIRVIETAVANLKSAVRFVRKSPTFSITVILTLALGIGANSAVFSAIDAILLRPLPFPNGDQLMSLRQYHRQISSPVTFVAPVRLEDWNRLNSTFQAITGYYTENESETTGVLPEKVTQAFVAPRFLQVWGVAPTLGRDFTSEELHDGGPLAVLITDHYWRQRFGSDPGVLGKKLRFPPRRPEQSSLSYTIVGVMPPSFRFPERDVDLWSPVWVDAPFTQSREATWYTAVGRLKPGVTLPQARADLATVQNQLGAQFPKTDADLAVAIEPLKEITVADSRSSLWILFGSVSLLLVIACTNIVSLLLARATQRQHEISVRFSLGASRTRIIGQLLTEVFVLALIGAGIGLFVATGVMDVFRGLARDLPRVSEMRLDARLVLYSLGCSVLVTLLCGLIPAIRGTLRNLSGSLAQASRTQVSGRQPLQWLLVVMQVALSVMLLSGAGLLLRSFQALGRVSPGFDTSHILTFHVSGSWGETADYKGLTQRVQRTIDFLKTIPGVENAATTAALPGVPDKYQAEFKFLEGEADPLRKIVVDTRFVSPRYFATMRIPLLEGQICREPPDASQLLVNRSFVDTYLGGSSPVGRHVRPMEGSWLSTGEIRGVVADTRESGINHLPTPAAYVCVNAPGPDPYYLVRTHNAPMTMAETLRRKIHEIEPGRSVFGFAPLAEHLSDAFSEDYLRTVLLGFFAATAISLACIGLYGTLSYSVQVRQREVGLRLALGALQGQIVKHFLGQGLGVSLLGCIVGFGLAAAFTRVLSGMLYGVSPTDLATLSTVILIVLLVATAASLAPSVRASRVDPVRVLREE